MRRSEKMYFALQFHSFVTEHGIEPRDAADMCDLKNAIGRYQLRSTGRTSQRDDAIADNRMERLKDLAKKYGFTVCFSNPYPALEKGKRDVRIPM